MDARDNIAQDLFYKIRSRFSGLKLGTESGGITIMPNEARFFDFDYTEEGTPIGHVSISLAEPNSMKVYFSNGITESMEPQQKSRWYGFLKELRSFAKRRLLAFDTRDIAKDNLDQRDYAFLSQNAMPKPQSNNEIQKPVGESVMSESAMYGTKTVSYQKLMDTRLIIKHNRALQDDTVPGARSRNISALFVENQEGERFKYPFIHLAGARAMQRHVANGGVPYDDVGKSIIEMSEQIAQLRSFGNYVVRNDLMNSDTNSIVERSGSALSELRDQVSRLSKQAYYEQYRDNFQTRSPLDIPDDVVEDFTEKFTVKNFKEDIKSVFPVLYRLMQEQSEVDYDDIVEMTAEQENAAVNEYAEVEVDNDPFEQFEDWVNGLGEASAIASQDQQERSAAVQQLQRLVDSEFPVGVDASNAIESVKGIIEDPEFYRDLKSLAKEDAQGDARPLVKAWLEENAPDVLEEIDIQVDEVPEESAMNIKESMSDTTFVIGVENVTAVGMSSGNTRLYLGKSDITALIPQDWIKEIERDYSNEDKAEGLDFSLLADVDYSIEPAQDGGRDDPSWDAYVEVNSISIVGVEGSDPVDPASGVDIDVESLDDTAVAKLEDKIMKREQGADDDRELDRRLSYREQSESSGNSSVDSQQLAEFIHSFYDNNTGTFPKGPESVATMVGKKFGEQAEKVARMFVERMAPQQATGNNPELQELARIKNLAGVNNEDSEIDEMDYQSFHDDEKLQDLRDAIDANKIVSVAVVTKNNTVRHMAIRKNLSAYIPSTREKTDRQANVEKNNNLKKVVSINDYNKKLKANKANGMEDAEAKADAAKGAWRSVSLPNVLGFSVGGKFIDLRDENNIMQRFGEEIYNSITDKMKQSIANPPMNAEEFDNSNDDLSDIRRLSGL